MEYAGGEHITEGGRTLMPGLAQLAGFGHGGCIVATIVAVIGVRWRACRHILHGRLHVRTVLASHVHARTGLQGQDNAQKRK